MPGITRFLERMATDVADRLLPAFNTTSGVPHTLVGKKFLIISQHWLLKIKLIDLNVQ